MGTFWYHGRMYDDAQATEKMDEYEAIIKELEKKISELELKIYRMENHVEEN